MNQRPSLIPLPTEALPQNEVAKEVASQTDPLDLLLQNSNFTRHLANRLGISVSELKLLMEKGLFDKVLSVELQALSRLALEEILERLEAGVLEDEILVKIATSFAELGQKLGGRDIKKTVIVTPEDLERLLDEGS